MNQLATRSQGQLATQHIQGLVTRWLITLDTKSTRKTYKQAMSKFLAYAESNEESNAVQGFKNQLLADSYAPATINLWLSAVKSFFEWCEAQQLISNNLAQGVKLIKRTQKRHKRKALTDNEVRRSIDAAANDDTIQGARNAAMLALMAYAGLRQVELKRANISDLDTLDGRLVLWVQGKGHTEKNDYIVINQYAENALRDYLAVYPEGKVKPDKSGKPLFVSFSNRALYRRLTTRTIRRITKNLFKVAGVTSAKKTTHSLRHTAITKAIEKSGNPTQVMGMSRHTNLNTVMIYFEERQRLKEPVEDMISYDG